MNLDWARSTLKAVARRGRSRVERLLYTGNKVHCNVCDGQARGWLKGREFGRCPNCRCASRTRVLWRYLDQAVTSPSELRVLHFAPEAPLRRRLASWGAASYKTCDLSAPQVDVHVDIQNMPFEDGAFDLVFCSHVLEHVPDHRRAMRELQRICSLRGRVLIQVPFDSAGPTREDLSELPPEERKRRFGEIDHLRFYGRDIVGYLEAAGFRVSIFEPAREIPIAERMMQGLSPDDVLFVCSPARH